MQASGRRGRGRESPTRFPHRAWSLMHCLIPEPMRPRPETNLRVRRSTSRATQASLDVKDFKPDLKI